MASISATLSGSLVGLLNQLIEFQADLATATLHLTELPFVPSPANSQAELVAGEVKSPGYVAKLVGPFLGPFLDQSLQPFLQGIQVVFTATPGSPSVQVSGGWLDDGTGSPLAVFQFNPPLAFGGPAPPSLVTEVELTGVISGRIEVVG